MTARERHLLLQPENIIFTDGNLYKLHRRFAIFRDLAALKRDRDLLVIQLRHPRRQRNQRLQIQFSGIDHADGQIVCLSFRLHRIRRTNPLQIQLLVKRQLPLKHNKTAALLLRMVEQYISQIPLYIHAVRSGADLLDHDLSLFQIQRIDIGLTVRNIDIILRRKLRNRLRPDTVHMYIFLYQLHKNTSTYILI